MEEAVKSSFDPPSFELGDFVASYGNGRHRLIVSVPHSGERIPPEADWLKAHDEKLLMFDVDRYVDQLYEPTLSELGLAWVKTEWHRYACDLNRLASDIDVDSVIGAEFGSGKFPRGLHWSKTTMGEVLMPKPMPLQVHQAILARCFHPFHEALNSIADAVHPKAARSLARPLFHLDLHSMPSLGTKEHRDPGESRADLVISNQDGASCDSAFFELVCRAGEASGFKVSRNWPYKGGRITETYGRPADGWQTVQIELNRRLYMDESSKQKLKSDFQKTKSRVGELMSKIAADLSQEIAAGRWC